MFLKKIKIKGFKSFAKTINLQFDTPITAIVGPNGSGKSNIVDATRWVLGEQSAKNLRGTEMADVIFSGSEKLPASSSAEVSLYLDNSERVLDIETDEVKISREVTEDGQSDYLINDSKCRLKDVNELLMDTGLGNNSYSIVSQGKITQIINSKPENLRELFEEAAGISKHKVRKNDAEKRLDNTTANLQRIKDLVWELEKQFKKVKKEAKKARQYKKMRGELEDIEINLLLDQYDDFSEKLKTLSNKKDRLEEALEEKENIAEQKKEKLKQKKARLREVEVNYDDKKDNYYQLRTKNEELKNRINIIKERKNNLKREEDELKKELNKLREDLNQRRNKLSKLNKNYEQENKKLGLMAEKKVGVTDDYQIRTEYLKQLREELNNYRENILEENADISQLKRKFDRLEEKLKYKERVIKDFKNTKEELLTNKAHFENKIVENEKMESRTKQKMEQVINDFKETKKQLKNHRNQYEKLKNKYESIQDKLYKKKSRKEFIEDLQKDYSGYYKGVKSILKESERFPEMYGAVAELIDVKKEFEVSINSVLGNKLQNIVVKNDKTAQLCINYLKEVEQGRATFLPIESLKSKRRLLTGNLKQTTGFLGLAVDFVNFADKYVKVMNYLMGRTIIVKDLESAVKISNIVDKKYKIVSQDGDVIYPGGSISGGSRQQMKNDLLNRKREIRELKEEIKDINSKVDSLVKKGLERKDDIEEFVDKKDGLDKEYQQLKLKEDNLISQKDELREQSKKINTKIEDIKDKIVEEKEAVNRLKNEKNNMDNIFKRDNKDYDQKKDIIQKKQKKINLLNAQTENMREKLTDIRVKYATQQEKIKSIKKEIENHKEAVTKNKADMADKKARLNEIKNEVEDLEKKKSKLIQQKKEYDQQVEDAHQEVIELEDELQKLRQEHEKLDRLVEKLNEELNNKKEVLYRVNIDYTKKSDKMESIEDRLSNEYDFNIKEDTYQKREPVKDPKKIEERVQQLRDKIAKLGHINPGSIQEYEELKKRLDYLHEQQVDLEDAKKSILNIISRIEESMMDKFKTTFYEIKEQFEDVFVELFNGGRAELSLVDETALLDTGVEIIAQPPGKKLKKLTLLSGGERALTAIALVFALLRVNPSPFYILDEIDAPLDDVNVVRFSNFLKEYTDFAQFVVVTHRKHMMTAVNNIYGLTMTDKGTTELVSLNLKEQIQ